MVSGSKQAGIKEMGFAEQWMKYLREPDPSVPFNVPKQVMLTDGLSVHEWLRTGAEIHKNGDYWQLFDWWMLGMRHVPKDYEISRVIRKVTVYFNRLTRAPRIYSVVYWVLDDEGCIYVGYTKYSAHEALQTHKQNKAPIGIYLKSVSREKFVQGLWCGYMPVWADNDRDMIALGQACKSIEIERRDPKLNDRL